MRTHVQAVLLAVLLAFSGVSSTATATEPVSLQPYRQRPVAVIEGRERVQLGNPVLLDASKSIGDAFVWLLDRDVDFMEADNGRKVYFMTSQPGRYKFTLVAISAPAKPGDAAQVAKTAFTVTYGDPGPGPDPTPPGPGPSPPTPDPGKYGLAAFTHQAAMAVATPNRKQVAVSLSSNFDAVASAIAAGAIKDPAKIVEQTYKLNAPVLTDPAWKSWTQAMRGRLNALSDGGQLTAVNDYVIAWREIAAGLRLVTAS